jgi:hypothetical protein
MDGLNIVDLVVTENQVRENTKDVKKTKGPELNRKEMEQSEPQ